MGTCSGVRGPGGQRSQQSEFLGDSSVTGQEGDIFPSLTPRMLVWGTRRSLQMDETSRCPWPGFCLSVQEPLSHLLSPGRIHFACVTHFHVERKELSSKRELENLSSRQIPFRCSRSTLSPLPCHPCLACLQRWVDHSHSHYLVLALGKFFHKLG